MYPIMKTNTFAILFLIGISLLRAQENKQAFGLYPGYAEDGVGIMADYSYYINADDAFHAALQSSFASYGRESADVNYIYQAVQLGFTKHIWVNYSRTVRLSALGGGLLGHEDIDPKESTLRVGESVDAKSQLVYGPYAGIELELWLSQVLSLVAKGNQSFHFNSDVGDTTPFIGAGLRYRLY